MSTTRDKLRDSLEQMLMRTWGEILGQIESIDSKALDLLSLEQKMHLHEMIIEAAGRCANFAAAFYCDGGDMLTVHGNIDKVTFVPGKGVTVAVAAINTPENIIALAEMGSGVSIHGVQTVIPNTVVPFESEEKTEEENGQMDLGEGEAEGEAREGEQTQGEESESAVQDLGTAEFNSDGTPRKLPDWWKNEEKGALAASGEPTREDIAAENNPKRGKRRSLR